MAQISSKLFFDMQEYLLDTWNAPKVAHSIQSVSRGPKGSIRASAVGSDSGADANTIGGINHDDDGFHAHRDESGDMI